MSSEAFLPLNLLCLVLESLDKLTNSKIEKDVLASTRNTHTRNLAVDF